ncbi:MAG TPA: BRCT domain-containing protein [Steroidobacteraceae bacterium]
MSVFKRLLSALPAEHHVELTTALSRGRANSYDTSAPNVPRRLASERRVATRNMDELIGMCRMVLADSAVDDHEARFLLDWIEKNYLAASEWPGNILYPRLAAAMADGHLDPEEEAELLQVLAKVAGGPPAAAGPAVSGAVPYDDPPPTIAFPSNCFVLTGQFVYGPRTKITAVIESRGGHVASAVSKKCNYLVVGTFGSDEWLHSTHGTKIIKAIELKQDGTPIRILTERHWTDQLA